MLQRLKATARLVPGTTQASRAAKYLRFRCRCWQEDWRDRSRRTDMPYPPAFLRFRIGGDIERDRFDAIGSRLADDLRNILRAHSRTFTGRVLDFGCGCGRVLRQLRSEPAELYGSDVDAAAIRWNRRNLPFATFSVNGMLPPLAYGAGTFDIIYAISVFTHLNEAAQFAWLDEIARVLRPGGVAILTVHGAWAQRARTDKPSAVDDSERVLIARDGFLFKVVETGHFKINGMPDSYQDAYHSDEYIHRTWQRGLHIVEIHHAASNAHQDAVVLIR